MFVLNLMFIMQAIFNNANKIHSLYIALNNNKILAYNTLFKQTISQNRGLMPCKLIYSVHMLLAIVTEANLSGGIIRFKSSVLLAGTGAEISRTSQSLCGHSLGNNYNLVSVQVFALGLVQSLPLRALPVHTGLLL